MEEGRQPIISRGHEGARAGESRANLCQNRAHPRSPGGRAEDSWQLQSWRQRCEFKLQLSSNAAKTGFVPDENAVTPVTHVQSPLLTEYAGDGHQSSSVYPLWAWCGGIVSGKPSSRLPTQCMIYTSQPSLPMCR